MENPYQRSPLQLAVFDPSSGAIIRSCFLLGQVPRAVLEAAKRETRTQADNTVLREYYGPSWRDKLREAKIPSAAAIEAKYMQWVAIPERAQGGQEARFVGLEDFDKPEIMLDVKPPGAEFSLQDTPEPLSALPPSAAHTNVWSNLPAYPEDTIADIRLKAYATLGIPPYRQHLFYTTSDGLLRVPYNFYVEGAPVSVDARKMLIGAGMTLAGVPVDPQLEEKKTEIKIDAMDTFTRLEVTPGNFTNCVFIVDLFAVLKTGETSAILRDRLQFDLLYYGFVVKYWPLLTPDALNTALVDASQMDGKYPLLSPDPRKVEAQLRAEQAIVDRTYLYRESKVEKAQTAVTSATINVPPKGLHNRVDVRNVFDWIATSSEVPAATVRFEAHSDVDTADVTQFVAFAKRHATSFLPRISQAVDKFVEQLPRRSAVYFALSSIQSEDSQSAQNLTILRIGEDGKYQVESRWREDAKKGFDEIMEDVAEESQQLIKTINRMGTAALPMGDELGLPTAERTRFGAITASVYWPVAVTSAGFKVIKDRLREYEKAGIIGIKGLQESEVFAFQFRKGIVAYDPSAIDRVVLRKLGADQTEETNRYAYLSDPTYAARWAFLYGGRTVRINHRVTDLRIEIIDSDGKEEFEMIKRYVFAFLYGVRREVSQPQHPKDASKAAQHPKDASKAAPHPKDASKAPPHPKDASKAPPAATRRLRRLQERDPELFDLKKHDPKATVYSVLCQSGRQPHVYDEAEAKALPRKKALVKYWNFTQNAPAYYECPNAKYPFLSFRAGVHPLGYCLVCCKKSLPAADSRAALVNETCRARRTGPTAEDLTAVRHVLAYGKLIPPGRLSEAAPAVTDGLLLDTLPAPFLYRTYGVEQSVPSVPDAGFMFSVGYLLSHGNEKLSKIVADLIAVLLSLGDSYRVLGSGAGAVFPRAQDLADALVDAFVARRPGLSPLGPGGAASSRWQDIVADLVRVAKGVEVVRLVDAEGNGRVSLEASPEAIEGLKAGGMMRVAFVASGPAGTHPLIAIDTHNFLRAAREERGALALKVFEGGAGKAPRSGEKVVQALKEAFSTQTATPRTQAGSPHLDLIQKFVADHGEVFGNKEFKITHKLINSRNLCYGVLLTNQHKQHIYLPIVESAHYPDKSGAELVFGPRPRVTLPQAALDNAIENLNEYIAKTKIDEVRSIVPEFSLMNSEGKFVGFVAAGLYYYHEAQADSPYLKGDGSPLPVVRMPYESQKVDEALYNASKIIRRDPNLEAKANEGSFENRLYLLFLAEFASIIQKERNSEVRNQVAALVKKTRFNSSRSVSEFRSAIMELLKEYPGDLASVKTILVNAYTTTSGSEISKVFEKTFDRTIFDFDHTTLQKLRSMARAEAVRAVSELMRGRVTHEDEAKAPENIFASCVVETTVPRPHCRKGKLTMPEAKFADFVDILVSDITNRYKFATFSVASAGSFDEKEFITRPGETIMEIVRAA